MDIETLVLLDAKKRAVFEKDFLEKLNRTKMDYGTAGFRDKAIYLDYENQLVFVKISNFKGIMVSASHNPVEDNGFKVSDFDGGMLREVLERDIEAFVNQKDLKLAIDSSSKLMEKEFNAAVDLKNKGLVFLGYDTRPSSKPLADSSVLAVEKSGCEIRNFGEVTTPQLHFYVWHYNSSPKAEYKDFADSYYQYFGNGFRQIVKKSNPKDKIILDAANGIGGTRVVPLLEDLKDLLNVEIINKNDTSKLNDKCGSEYVQKEKQYPLNARDTIAKFSKENEIRCLSFDGDADRIVYYLPDNEKIRLFDGDKISGLFAFFVITMINKSQPLIDELKKEINALELDLKKWTIGVIQTAYANGSSTTYFKDLKINVKCAPTGIKNLHHEAVKYDVGVYFESNGHGTMLINSKRLEELEKNIALLKDSKNPKAEELLGNLVTLKNFLTLANQAVGDAISVFLMIEAALIVLPLTMEKWEKLWEDLPSKTTKVKVLHRQKIKNTWDQTRVTEPEDIQKEIDDVVKKYEAGRAFIRPSGTEDVVRLYVEGKNESDIENMTKTLTEVILNNKTIN